MDSAIVTRGPVNTPLYALRIGQAGVAGNRDIGPATAFSFRQNVIRSRHAAHRAA